MAYIDIDLDDFTTIDLIDELNKRLSRRGHNFLGNKDLRKAISMMRDLSAALHVCVLPIESIDDQSKRDVLIKYWPELTSYQLEEKLSK